MENRKTKWEDSYRNRDNFLFYPNEEVIRFVSKYIRKRIGYNEFTNICSFKETPKILDLGCGIGRHIMYCYDMGLEAYGIDLSEIAIQTALQWATQKSILSAKEKIKQGDIQNLPWPEEYFDFVISHAVLDSMNFDFSKIAIKETARVLKTGGLFYCDLISGDDSSHAREFSGEEIVDTLHEQGTIQLYFNFTKINQLVNEYFEIVECILVRRENVINGSFNSRYHLILRK